MEIDKDQLAQINDALYRADVEHGLRGNYSGRGMMGDECIGFVGSVRHLARFFVELSEQEERDGIGQDADGGTPIARSLADNLSMDNMGMSSIFYFPSYRLSDEARASHEAEDE